jgi:subtilisin family serine protease
MSSVTPTPVAITTPVTSAASDALLIKLAARPASTLIRSIDAMPRGAERKAAAWNVLADVATTSQQPFIALAEQLKNSGAIQGYETLVSPNMLIVDPAAGKSREVFAQFQALQGVKAIYDNNGAPLRAASASLDRPALTHGNSWGLDLAPGGRGAVTSAAPAELPYGLNMIGAPEAWKSGATGKGLVYGSIDTGADFTHEAIANKYRGQATDGTVSHDYNWMDWGSRRSPKPVDPDAHGTHTIGTVLGHTDAAPIGVAPEAQWISARGLTGGADVRLKSLQWMQAPTKHDGTAPDPAKAPDVVGMSWWTGPSTSDFFLESIQNLRLAGIEPVKSAGNKGPNPETISAPGQLRELNAIAAVGPDGQIAEFSSRGPSPMHTEGATPDWKPDFAAPGVGVLSSVPGNKYQQLSGTSMAQPHFSGVLLALMSKYPQLTHDQLGKILAKTSTDVGARGRDLEFGYGIVNIPAALAEAARVAQGQPTPAVR